MNEIKSLIESVGTYLPPRTVTTGELLRECVNPVNVPLERLTGIRTRRFAGDTEFSIDLASKAITDCLKHSAVDANQFDLLISANISRWDGPGCVGYEPSTAIALKRMLGFDRAIAFDISNACASVWTAVYIVDGLIQAGVVKHAMVVSGEYISHLTRTAQKEIVSYLDPQLASLTLGDAGIAVSMSATSRPDIGFNKVDLYTLGAYSRLCVAKPSDQPHGGAVMHTDAVKVTASVVPHAAAHAEHVLRQSGRHVDDIHHIIPHQTSRMTIKSALEEIAKRFQTDCSGSMIDNLEQRGNTASTTHFLALRDCIDSGRIRSGDRILFAISGSGQTTGTAIYTCDDLPDRIRAGAPTPASANGVSREIETMAMATPFRFESIAVQAPPVDQDPDTLTMLKQASQRCFEMAQVDRSELELVISVGVYRSEFLTEPALAALLAGDLDINADRAADDDRKTFAFDLLNGSLGFLNACYLVSELGRAGRLERAMVVASEIENNAGMDDRPLLGIRQMASATILAEAEDGETGFQAFQFDHYPQHHDLRHVVGNWTNQSGRPSLNVEIKAGLEEAYLDSIGTSVDRFLNKHDLTMDSIQFLLPPRVNYGFAGSLAGRLGVNAEKTQVVTGELGDDGDHELDYFTSSTPVAMAHIIDNRLAKPGDIGLLINVGAGLQVACALYRF
jgi:3-oxoacyl-[acyl-carrier-protein] synthase III